MKVLNMNDGVHIKIFSLFSSNQIENGSWGEGINYEEGVIN